jgi:4-hydroxy-tetrahydrodipicolinate reductase
MAVSGSSKLADKTINVIIAGIGGRMGKASAVSILADAQLRLVGGFDKPGAPCVGQDIGQLTGSATTGILVSNGIEDLPEGAKPEVMLDFSLAQPAFEHAIQALQKGISPVIGVSGLGEDKIKQLAEEAKSKKLGAMVVPNFSLGAVLMMEFARQAGAFYKNCEIVEMHHNKKVDAPSGTATHTAEKLAQSGACYNNMEVTEKELLPGVRGAKMDSGVRVHSLRLPGLISHQEVIFGAAGELLTIKHDSFNTDCFMTGIRMAIKAVRRFDHLVIGLENILSLDGGAA